MMSPVTSSDGRRFYAVAKTLTIDATAYDWVNRVDCLPNGNSLGRREDEIDGWNMKVWTGLPNLRQQPRLKLRARRKLLDFYGYGPYFVSSAAKELLCEFDADAFEMAECETINVHGRRVEPYWIMGIKRLVQTIDENRSVFQTWADRFPNAPDAETNPAIMLNELVMPSDFPAYYHAFLIARYQLYFIADGILVDNWRALSLTGAEFTPLQVPTRTEWRGVTSFVNNPYWLDRADLTGS